MMKLYISFYVGNLKRRSRAEQFARDKSPTWAEQPRLAHAKYSTGID